MYSRACGESMGGKEVCHDHLLVARAGLPAEEDLLERLNHAL
jgi:hypothetical protein